MVILKGIPPILSPQILSVLGEMGHGDELVLADANFPAESTAKHGPKLIRADGHGCLDLLEATLQLLPLDTYETPMYLMQRTPEDEARCLETPIWDEYKKVVHRSEGRSVPCGMVERFAFYEQAKKSYAIIATGESALYGNIILKKGVL